jgi:stage IV sporulation protein FB
MLHLGSIGKTTIDVDFSFFILLVVFVAYGYNPGLPIQYALIWIPIIFVSVLFHELAHAAMIKLLGFGSSRIVLGGMGGVTINERRAKPWQDLLISVAGPASNIVLMFATWWFARNLPIAQTDRMLVALLPRLIEANWWWAIFNMIPVPPLDGGHATREFFRIFLSERTAFIIAIWIAMIVGSAVVVFAIVSRSVLMAFYLGWFVYAAWQQWQYFRQHGIPGD